KKSNEVFNVGVVSLAYVILGRVAEVVIAAFYCRCILLPKPLVLMSVTLATATSGQFNNES
ncbi:hypothetical protein INT47_003343, partial [Mucor saturninus]